MATEDTRSLQELAREALQVQDACNLLGVSKSYARALDRLWVLQERSSMRTLAEHPIAQVWADKIAHLTGTQGGDFAVVHEAFRLVHTMAHGQVAA